MRTTALVAAGLFLLGGAASAQTGGVGSGPSGVVPPTERHVSPTEDPANPAGPNPTPETNDDGTRVTDEYPPGYANTPPTMVHAMPPAPWMSRVGTAVLVGGGWEDFSNSGIQ